MNELTSGPLHLTDHVVLERTRYEELTELERRAREKLAQLRVLPEPTTGTHEHIRVLAWLLGE